MVSCVEKGGGNVSTRGTREDDRLFEAAREAASITCHRISQFGWDSYQAANAHEAWRKAWLRWRDFDKKPEES